MIRTFHSVADAMAHPSVRARTLAAVATSAAMLAGASGCAGASTSAGASQGPSIVTSAAAPTTSASTAASGSSAATGSSPGAGSSAAAHASAASGGVAACGNADIAVSLGPAGAAMNHAGQAAIFKNVSGHACTLQGYPGAAVISGSGSTTLVNATRQLNGYIGDMRQLSSVPLVTLQPGQSASAELEWLGDAGEQCYPNGSGELAVTPPNTTHTVSLRTVLVGTQGICAGFQVHPVVAGVLHN